MFLLKTRNQDGKNFNLMFKACDFYLGTPLNIYNSVNT